MKVSLIQTNPQSDRAANIAKARQLMEEAVAADQPDLIVLPEYFEAMGVTAEQRIAMAEPYGGSAYQMAQAFAKTHGVFVHAGSVMEKVVGENRNTNTTYVFNARGEEIARYSKIHMFDIETPDGTVHKESASTKPGETEATYDIDGLKVGCTICYDLRFSELYVRLQKAGCDVIVVPAAFTLQTGKDHWEVLLRARAIETQTYVLGCGQIGPNFVNGEKRACYGHSLVCDPWGHTVCRASDTVGFVTARIDKRQIERVRGLIPMMQHRRLA